MKTWIAIMTMILSSVALAQSRDDLRVDFSGSSAKEAFLKLQKISEKDDSIRVSHGAGATELSSSNLNCRYTEDDSGRANLKKVDSQYFSCYVLVNKKGDIGCEKAAPQKAAAPKKEKQGSM